MSSKTGILLHRALFVGASLLALAPAAARAETAAAPDKAAMVDELVVTAEHREERLRDVPIAVSAFRGDELKTAEVTSTQDLTRLTAGLNFTRSAFSNQPTIRGIGTRSASAGDESVVPVYIDGVYQPFIHGLIQDFLDVDHVEVLKGPQGALYGRNATGGAINIVTRVPTAAPEADFSVTYGNLNTEQVLGYLTGGTDTVKGSLAFNAHNVDGYVRDVVRNTKLSSISDFQIKGKVLYQPTDNLDVTLTAGDSNIVDNTSLSQEPLNGNTSGPRLVPGTFVASAPYQVALTIDPFFKVVEQTGSASILWRGPAFDLHSITGYMRAHMKEQSDSDSTPAPANLTNLGFIDKSLYQEVYATSKGSGRFSWIVGGVYYHDSAVSAPQRNTAASLTPGATFGQRTQTTVLSDVKTDSYAAYAQVRWEISDEWSATVEGRYTSDHKTFVTQSQALNLTTNAVTSLGPFNGSKTWPKFTPTLTIAYAPSETAHFYAKAGKGFKSGVYNAATTSTVPVNPESVTQYELGMKLDPTPRLRANFATYYSTDSNVQLQARDPVTNNAFLINAAREKIYGVEGEVYFKATDNLDLFATSSLIHGKYSSFPNAAVTLPLTAVSPNPATACVAGTGALLGGNRAVFCDVSGKDIIRTPFVTVSAGFDFTQPVASGNFELHGNLLYLGKSYWDSLDAIEQPAVTTANAEASWAPAGNRYKAILWVRNLTDKKYDVTRGTSTAGDYHVMAPPRTYGVRLEFTFR